MEQPYVAMVKHGVLAAGLSLLLYKLSSSTVLFTIPLLFFSTRFRPIKYALVPVAIVLLTIIIQQLVVFRGSLHEPALRGVLTIGLYMPISLLVGCGVWIVLEHKRMLVKLLYGSLFAAATGLLLVWWFSGTSATSIATLELFKDMMNTLIPSLMNSSLPMGVSPSVLYEMVVLVLKLAFFPLFLGQFGLSVFISELLLNRKNRNFQERMTRWSLPNYAVWVFLGGWTAVLLTLLVEAPVIESIAWNMSLSITLLYMIQGISILSHMVQKKIQHVSVVRIFVLSLFMVILPGINVIPMIGFPLLGVSETWIRYRKIV